MRDLYNEMIGNIPCLTEWTNELPPYPITTPQPWLFSKRINTGLLILKSNNNITFTFHRRTKISELLRMKVKIKNKDGYEYKEIPCNLNYLDMESDSLPIPELWGRYCQMSDPEREHRKRNEIKHEIWYDDIIITSSNNPTPLGSNVIIPLHNKTPVRHIFWMAQNIKTIKNRNFSNYTTNIEDLYTGFSPCARAGIKYGGSNRVPELPYYHFSRSEAYDFFPSAPTDPGYHVYTFSYDPVGNNADSSVDIDNLNASLNLKLGDTDIFKSVEETLEEFDEEGNIIPVEALEEDEAYLMRKEQYIVHVRLVVYKKLEIQWSNEENKLKYLIIDDVTV